MGLYSRNTTAAGAILRAKPKPAPLPAPKTVAQIPKLSKSLGAKVAAQVAATTAAHAAAHSERNKLVKLVRKQYPSEYGSALKGLTTTNIGGMSVKTPATRSQKQAALTSVLQTHRPKPSRSSGLSLPSLSGVVDEAAKIGGGLDTGAPNINQQSIAERARSHPLDVAADVAMVGVPELRIAKLAALAKGAKVAEGIAQSERGAKAIKGVEQSAEAVKGSRAARGATKVVKSRPVKVAVGTGRVLKRNAGKTAFGTPFAAQVPAAVQHGNPSELKKALTGEGVFAKGLHGAATVTNRVLPGVVGNAAQDAISLPADILPTTYFAARAGVKAAEGHPQEAEALWKNYKDTGFLPKLVQGDIGGAAKTFEKHPVYSALEASGAYAGLGRGAGVLARRAPIRRIREVGSTKRQPKGVYGTVQKEQNYSANLVTKAAQVASEARKARRGENPFHATGGERRRYLNKAVDDFEGATEGRRRSLLQEAVRDVERKRPGRLRPIAKGDKQVVSEVAQGLIRNKDTWHQDIGTRIAQLKANELRPGTMTRAEKRSNRQQIDALEHAKRIDDPKRIGAIFEAADVYRTKMRDATGRMVDAGLLNKDQVSKAAAIPFARTHMGADYGMPRAAAKRYEELRAEMGATASPEQFGQISKEMAQLRATAQTLDHKGEPLPLADIQAEMKRHGVDPVFLSHRQGARGKGSFYQPWSAGRSNAADKVRTGAAVTKGSYDATWDAMVEQVASATTKANRAQTFDDFIKRFAVRPKGGYFKDMAEARDAVLNPDRYRIDTGGVEMTPVRLTSPGSKKAETVAAKRRGDPAEMDRALSPDSDPNAVLSDMLAVAEKDVGNGPVVLVPKQVMDRFREHAKPAGTTLRAAQALNGAFKSTVLPLSPRWIYGNAIEPFIRSALTGLTPVDYVAGKRLAGHVKRTDPGTFRDLEQRTLGGTLFGAADRQRIHRDASQFVDTNVGPLANAVTAFANAPVARNLTKMYRAYRDSVFALNSRLLEREPQFAALGKAARKEVQQTAAAWHKSLFLGEKALGDLAKGLKNTDHQLAYADSVAQIFGNWYRNSPDARTAIMSYAPFYGWARASGTFVFHTLPRHHPIKTAILTGLVRATQSQREAYGGARTGKHPLPASLQGALPGGIRAPGPKDGEIGQRGGIIPIAGLSSFGSWSNPLSAPGNFIAPELQGVLDAFAGRDWKGDPLKDSYGRPASEGQRILDAGGAFAEAMLPPYALYQRVKSASSPGDFFKPVRPIKHSTTQWLRTLGDMQTIRVPLSKETRAKLRQQP